MAKEPDVFFINLKQRSMDHFSEMEKEYVTQKYYSNFPAGVFEAYPEGQEDHTHFKH